MTWLPSKHRPAFFAFAILGCLLVTYVASYLCLSAKGRYEPMVFGLNHVKWYDWIPHGFMENGEFNRPVAIGYYPLWQLDRRFWHKPRRSLDGT